MARTPRALRSLAGRVAVVVAATAAIVAAVAMLFALQRGGLKKIGFITGTPGAVEAALAG